MADSLVQHRLELDATFATLQAVRDHAVHSAALHAVFGGELSELRAELRALSNRVEALTRAAGLDELEHSVRVSS